MIAIVTESLSCMNVADCAATGVSLAPMDCVADGVRAHDRIIVAEETIPAGQGYSVPPTEDEYRTRFTALLSEFDGILCITASRKFSDSNRHALHAAAPLGGRVEVVESESVAGGLFLLALRARHLATLGHTLTEIRDELETYKRTLRVSFSAASAATLANAKKLTYTPVSRPILSRRPVFRIKDGGISVASFASGAYRLAEELLTVFDPAPGESPRPPRHVVVHYADRTDTVEYLARLVRERYPDAILYERPITLSLQFNLGYDIVGLIGD